MTAEDREHGIKDPIIQLEPTKGMRDYFCPFCGQKLFRGDVKQFSMVCDSCNRLVRSADPDQSDMPDTGSGTV